MRLQSNGEIGVPEIKPSHVQLNNHVTFDQILRATVCYLNIKKFVLHRLKYLNSSWMEQTFYIQFIYTCTSFLSMVSYQKSIQALSE